MTRKTSERGQSIVEMALVLPIFILVLVAIFDLGHVVWANDQLSNAAREAARFAIVHGGSESTACPVGPPVDPAVPPPTNCPIPVSPSKQAIRDAASNWARSAGLTVTTWVCYWDADPMPDVAACDAADDSVDTDPGNNARGQKVSVMVTASVALAVPSFFGMGSINVSSTSTMLVNH
jgi:hypothetical protein